MKTALRWTAIEIGRRKFLYSLVTSTFGIAAALTVGQRGVYASCPCAAPQGGGYCGDELCGGNPCGSHNYGSYQVYCSLTTCCCAGGTGCWSCPGYSCCDCYCLETLGNSYYYCYCH